MKFVNDPITAWGNSVSASEIDQISGSNHQNPPPEYIQLYRRLLRARTGYNTEPGTHVTEMTSGFWNNTHAVRGAEIIRRVATVVAQSSFFHYSNRLLTTATPTIS